MSTTRFVPSRSITIVSQSLIIASNTSVVFRIRIEEVIILNKDRCLAHFLVDNYCKVALIGLGKQNALYFKILLSLISFFSKFSTLTLLNFLLGNSWSLETILVAKKPMWSGCLRRLHGFSVSHFVDEYYLDKRITTNEKSSIIRAKPRVFRA